jgi:hypothetical protein
MPVPHDKASTPGYDSPTALTDTTWAGGSPDFDQSERNVALRLLLRAASRLSDHPDRLGRWLQSILDSPDQLALVADRSSVHPNGFAKIVLHAGSRYSVRLHVWKRRAGLWVEDTQPHGHRWVFASWVVVGTVREVVFFSRERPGSGVRYDWYDYSRGQFGPQLQLIGTAALDRGDVIDRGAGVVYGRARDTLHTATPVGEDLVASLVLQGPHHPEPTPVYVESGQEPLQEELTLSVGEVRSLIGEVIATLPAAELTIPSPRDGRSAEVDVARVSGSHRSPMREGRGSQADASAFQIAHERRS